MQPFLLERFFAVYEFSTRYLLCASDCESLKMSEVLAMADDEMRAAWQNLSLAYTESLGLPALRQEIVKMYPGLNLEQIMIGAPEEAIYIAMRTLLKPGDHVVSTFPEYQSLYEIGREIGCQVSPWHARETESGWRFDLNELDQILQHGTRMVIVNFPHNPTGFLPDRAFFDELIAMVAERGAYLFCDEMYRQLEDEVENRLPAACTLYPRAISLSGLSKAYALPGLRIGWLATRDQQAFEAFKVYKDYTTICASAPSEILATIGLRNGERIAGRNREIIRENKSLAHEMFRKYPQVFKWHESGGSSIGFHRLQLPISIDDFCHELVTEKEVLLAPGRMFEVPTNHFRMGYGRLNFPQGLALLEEYIQKYV